MNLTLAANLLEDQGVQPDPKHVTAAASTLTGLLKTVAERFAKLPFEAEPSGFAAEQRSHVP